MFVSKAMQNMRGDTFGSASDSTVESIWRPKLFSAYSQNTLQGAGTPQSGEFIAGVTFSNGAPIPDSSWNTLAASLFSYNNLITHLAANVPACTMAGSLQTTGQVRLVNRGNGERVFESVASSLGKIVYAPVFNRMYIFITTVTAMDMTTAAISTVLEFTVADLISMGVPVTDNGDGTGTINGAFQLNNIVFS